MPRYKRIGVKVPHTTRVSARIPRKPWDMPKTDTRGAKTFLQGIEDLYSISLETYKAVCNQPLIIVEIPRKILWRNYTAKRHMTLNKFVKDTFTNGEYTPVYFMLDLVNASRDTEKAYFDLSAYGLPNGRVYRRELDIILTAYENRRKTVLGPSY